MSKKARAREERVAKRNKQAKYRVQATPAKRPVVVDGGLDDSNRTILWSFSKFDNTAQWADNASNCFCEVTDYLKEFENRTWNEVSQDGGRNHEVEQSQLGDIARRRLADIALDDVDALWSFRFKGRWRLWGIRDRRVFQVLWWDPCHLVYPIDIQDR